MIVTTVFQPQHQRRLGGADRNPMFENDRATGNLFGHEVPRDRVLLFVAADGQAWGVGAAVSRKRTIVHVQCRDASPSQYVVGNCGGIRDADNHIDVWHLLQRVECYHFDFGGPVPARRTMRTDSDDLMTGFDVGAAAMNEGYVLADQRYFE